MTDKNKVKFVNYYFRMNVTSDYKCDSDAIQLHDDAIKPIPIETKNKPNLLINIYDKNNHITDYTNTIHDPKLKNALFVYLSNNINSDYNDGSSLGTAMIGDYEHTFGIITGQWDTKSEIPKAHKPDGDQEDGFQNLDETNTFKLCHRADKKTYDVTPKQAIDYLLGQLYELIKEKKYMHLILPCVLDPTVQKDDYHKYTLGGAIFNAHPNVKRYIYDKICDMTQASSGGWKLITEFLK
jgi:hypothetical protein